MELMPLATTTVEQPVTICVTFAVPRSRTGKLSTLVGDGDNYEKAIYDLIQTKKYLSDDRLITTATWRKRFVAYGEQGYTEITMYAETEEIEL